jgi:hypothetical protein
MKFHWGLLFIFLSSCNMPVNGSQQILITPKSNSTIISTVASTSTPLPPTSTIIPPTKTIEASTPTSVPTSQSVSPQPTQYFFDQVKPSADDDKMTRGKVFIDSVKVLQGSNPSSAGGLLKISGSLPNPCNQLRANLVDPTLSNFTISLEIYSLIDREKICIQSIAPFELNIPLNELKTGSYTVVINQSDFSTFDWPLKQ